MSKRNEVRRIERAAMKVALDYFSSSTPLVEIVTTALLRERKRALREAINAACGPCGCTDHCDFKNRILALTKESPTGAKEKP